MLLFLDKRNRMKYDVLYILSIEETRTLSVKELQEKIGVSTSTLNKLLKEIKQDLSILTSEKLLTRSKDGNQTKYSFNMKNELILNDILYIYLTASIKFNLVEEIFKEQFNGLEYIAGRYFISTSTLRREVDELREVLAVYNLELEGFSELRIKGNEETLRLFYTYFFFEGYQGKEWPFENMLPLSTMVELYDSVPEELSSEADIKTRIFIIYSFGVNLIRQMLGYRIERSSLKGPLYQEVINQASIEAKETTMRIINQKVESLSNEELDTEVDFIYSFIIAHKDYHCDHDVILPFFITNPALVELKFMEEAYQIANTIGECLSVNLTAAVFYDLLFKIIILHYRVLLFDLGCQDCSHLLTLEKNSSCSCSEKSPFESCLIERFEKDESLPRLGKNSLQNYYLISNYSKIASYIVKKYGTKEKVRVLLIANSGEYEYLLEGLSNNEMDLHFQIEIITLKEKKEADVVISDIAVDLELLGIKKEIPIIYFETSAYRFSVKDIFKNLLELYLAKNTDLQK